MEEMKTLDLTSDVVENVRDLIYLYEQWNKQTTEKPDSVELTPKQEMLIGCELKGSDYYQLGSLKSILGITIVRNYETTVELTK